MIVELVARSDFWRTTAYGSVRDTGHALLVPFLPDTVLEVTFLADFERLRSGRDADPGRRSPVDQGGDRDHGWRAACRGGRDEWTFGLVASPVPAWQGQTVIIHANRSGDAVTLRARTAEPPWRTIRLAPLAVDAIVKAGPMCCSPERGGLKMTFTRFVSGPADTDLSAHPARLIASDHSSSSSPHRISRAYSRSAWQTNGEAP